MDGDDGSDLLYGGAGDDWLEGGDGADGLYGGTGADTALGGAGDDAIWIDGGLADGGADDDSLYASAAATLRGDAGNDFLNLEADGGTASLEGGLGRDTIFVWHEGSADDQLIVDGGDGADRFSIYTRGVSVDLIGGAGDDDMDLQLDGSEGQVDLGAGNDTLQVFADAGLTITTGTGRDVIAFKGVIDNPGLIITDFTAGVGGDVLDLERLLDGLSPWPWPGGNPFAGGYLQLVAVGRDT